MKRMTREQLPYGGHTVCEWDDETGEADLTQYDADGTFVRRFQVRNEGPSGPAGEDGAVRVDLDVDGNEIGLEKVRRLSEAEAQAGGWT
jgi:hypothetical protein